MRLTIIIFSFCLASEAISRAYSCFKRYRNMRINCSFPTDRRSLKTLNECEDFCLSRPDECLFAQYEYYKKICELHKIPSPLDEKTDKDLLDTFFRARRGIISESKCSPSLQRSIGVIHIIPNLVCLVPKDPSNIRRSEDNLPKISLSMPSDTEIPKDPFNDVMIVPIVPDCPIGERAKVQVIDGVEVSSEAAVSFKVDRVEKCIESCRGSMYPKGNRLPILCRSATFDRITSKCQLFSDALNPNGYMDYKPANHVIYMEKICMAESLVPTACDDVFRRVPQHILLGHAAEIVTAASQSECVKECVQAKNRRLECHSVLHYLDVPYQNCILNIHTRNTRPEYFVPEVRYKVDYIEISNCASAVASQQLDSEAGLVSVAGGSSDRTLKIPSALVQPEKVIGKPVVESEWTEWTACDRTTALRMRDRVCTECQEQVQTEPCIPNENNEFSASLQEFMHKKEEEEKDTQSIDLLSEKSGFLSSNSENPIITFPTQGNKTGSVEFFGPPVPVVSDGDATLRRIFV